MTSECLSRRFEFWTPSSRLRIASFRVATFRSEEASHQARCIPFSFDLSLPGG